MSGVEIWDDGPGLPDRLPADVDIQRPPSREGGVDLHKARGLDLTPEEKIARRGNRRWMLGLAIPSIAILTLALYVSGIAQSNEPNGPNITPPAGYQAIRDGYYSYAVPASWTNNGEFTDGAGDVETSGTSGWAGENISYFKAIPTLGATPPKSLQALGSPHPESFALTGGHPISVPGAAGAFEYTATRPGGFRAVAIDAWSTKTGVELWLMVDAPPAVTSELLSSLRSS